MTSPSRPTTIGVNLEVQTEAQAAALKEAWMEIVTGKRRVHTDALDHEVDAVMERISPRGKS